MHENASACHLVFFDSIRNGHFVFSNEPHLAIDATMIGEVERHLLLARRIGLVVAVVGFDGDDKIVANSRGRKGDGDRQIATLVFFHLLAIDIDGLLAHDGLEMQGNVTASTFRRQREMLAIPGNALIVATTTGFCWHQLDSMGCGDHLPGLVIEVFGLSTSNITQMEAPASVEVPHQSSTIL